MRGQARTPQADDSVDLSTDATKLRYFAMMVGMVLCRVAIPVDVARAVPTFTNVTAAMGITHTQSSTQGSEPMSGGAAAADFDGDGLVDLFFTRVDAPPVLYRNTGNGFEDVSVTAGFSQALPTTGTAAGDIDNDGDLDLYVTATAHSRFSMYINDGAGHFIEEGITRGAAVQASGTNWRGMGVAFGDYDRDGYLDIMTSDHSRSTSNNGSRLLRNLGASNPGHFEDVTEAAGLNVYRQALHVQNMVYRFQPQFTDLDQDGHTDIVFSADDRTSQLFWNNGDGTFTDGTVAAGVGTDKSGMGSALADYDGDGDLDWLVTAIYDTPFVGVNPGNRLYRNNGNRTFTDVTTASGVRNTGAGQELSWGWGASFLDYDNDSDQDLAMTNGWVALGYGGDDTTLHRNNGDGTFSEVTSPSGISDTGQGRGLVRLDFDVDGDLDMLVVNFGAAPILYRNEGGNEASWLRVKTEGTVSNRDGLGALITVTPDLTNPAAFQIWEVGSGSGYLSQDEMTAHFGLGDFSGTVDQVTIKWPSGILQQFADVTPNSLLFAREALLGDFNGDLTVNGADLLNWQAEYGAASGPFTADANGDGNVDGRDFLIWQRHVGVSVPQIGAIATVPEPNSATLIVSLGLALVGPGRRIRVAGLPNRKIHSMGGSG